MKKIFYLVLCLFLLLGCENLSQESKDSFVQQNTSAPQQTPSADNVDADKVPNEDTNQEINKEAVQDSKEEVNKENVNQGINQGTPEKPSQGTNQGTPEKPSQGTNQDNNDNQEVIPTEKPDNYTGEIWVQGVTRESGWVDVNKWKGLVNSTEGNSCWMATSANVLADYYRRHNYHKTPSATEIYQEIYNNSGGDGAGTYLNGIPGYVERTEVGKIYPTGVNRDCLCLSNCDDIQVMSKALIKNLHKGAAGIKFIWVKGDGSGHALTLWGATFENGILTKIHVTDSDDDYEDIQEYAVQYVGDKILVPNYILGSAYLREVYIPF